MAPTQEAPIARPGDAGTELVLARWGLVPGWAKDTSGAARAINARSETAPEKPMFRSAFLRRRCIVPVSGFYEWEKRPTGPKQPWYIFRADGAPMLLAGLWESWRPPEGGEALETFTVLTTGANSAIAPVHDRMPAVLEPEQVARWLDAGTGKDDAHAMLAPAAGGVLAMHRVGRAVNSPRNNGPGLIERVDRPEGADRAVGEGGLFGTL